MQMVTTAQKINVLEQDRSDTLYHNAEPYHTIIQYYSFTDSYDTAQLHKCIYTLANIWLCH